MYNYSGFSSNTPIKELSFVECTPLEAYMLLSGRRKFVGHALAATVFKLAELGMVRIDYRPNTLTILLVNVPKDMPESLAETLQVLFGDPDRPGAPLVLDGAPMHHVADQLTATSRIRLTQSGLLRKCLEWPHSVVVMFKWIFALMLLVSLVVTSTVSVISAIMALLAGLVSYMVLFTFWLDREHLPLTAKGKHERERHLRLLGVPCSPAFSWEQLLPQQLRKPPQEKPAWWTAAWPTSKKERARLINQAFLLTVKSFSSSAPQVIHIAK